MNNRPARVLLICALLCLFFVPLTVLATVNVTGESDDLLDKLNELTEGATVGRDANGNLTMTGEPTNEFGKRLKTVIVATQTVTITSMRDADRTAAGLFLGNGRQIVDLDDIEKFHGPGSDLPTEGAQLIHEIFEVYNSVKDGKTTPPDEDGGKDFKSSHRGSAKEAEDAVNLEESGITRIGEGKVISAEELPDGSTRYRIRERYRKGDETIEVDTYLIEKDGKGRIERVERAPATPGKGRYIIGEDGLGLRLYDDQFGDDGFIALDNPGYLAIDLLGNLYVSEQDLDVVLVFDASAETLAEPAQIGHATLNDPQGIAVSLLNNNIFVGSDDAIVVFDLGGAFVTTYTHPLLQDVRGLQVDGNGYVYASSFESDMVLVFAPPDGELLTTFQDTQLDGPTGIAIDQLGNVWVASYHNHRVVRFEPDGDFDGALAWPDELIAPTGLALTPQSAVVEGIGPGALGDFHETLLVASSGAGLVLEFDLESGALLDSVAVNDPLGVARMEIAPAVNRIYMPLVFNGG